MMSDRWQHQMGPAGLLLRWLVVVWLGVTGLLVVGWVMIRVFRLVLWAFVVAAPVALVYAAYCVVRNWVRRRRAERQGHQVVEVRRVCRVD